MKKETAFDWAVSFKLEFGGAEVEQPPPEGAFPSGEGGPGAARDG